MNFEKSFIFQLDSIFLLGLNKSKNNYCEFMHQVIQNTIIKSSDKTIKVNDPISRKDINIKIILGPLLCHTPQRLLGLSLMKDECSTCLQFFIDRYMTPD
jgi:hypothetical protein